MLAVVLVAVKLFDFLAVLLAVFELVMRGPHFTWFFSGKFQIAALSMLFSPELNGCG